MQWTKTSTILHSRRMPSDASRKKQESFVSADCPDLGWAIQEVINAVD